MSERKVLNKYYPPDFDPSKIPKLRLPKNRQYSIRIMAPFNMRCNTCAEYIYKGKKFNSRKETVEDEDYLGLRIFRFYIKCPRCVAEIAFKTDPENTDYTLEDGATRNFEAAKTAEMMAKKEQEEKDAEELNNPMKVLENRTKASQQEMEMLETLEELRDLNSRHAKVDHDQMIATQAALGKAYEEQLKRLQEEEDEQVIESIFGRSGDKVVKRLQDDDNEEVPPAKKVNSIEKPTDFLTQNTKAATSSSNCVVKKPAVWEKSVGSISSKSSLGLLVKKKKTSEVNKKTFEVNSHQEGNTSNEDSKNSDTFKSPGPLVEVKPIQTVNGPPSGLGLLGGYDSSDSGNDSN